MPRSTPGAGLQCNRNLGSRQKDEAASRTSTPNVLSRLSPSTSTPVRPRRHEPTHFPRLSVQGIGRRERQQGRVVRRDPPSPSANNASYSSSRACRPRCSCCWSWWWWCHGAATCPPLALSAVPLCVWGRSIVLVFRRSPVGNRRLRLNQKIRVQANGCG